MQYGIDRAGSWRPTNEQLLRTLATAIPVWNFYGFAINFFRETWGDAPLPVIPISYGLNASFVVLLPFLGRQSRGELRAAALLGTAMAVWSAVGMGLSPASKMLYTAVPTVLGSVTAAVALSALRRGWDADEAVPGRSTA